MGSKVYYFHNRCLLKLCQCTALLQETEIDFNKQQKKSLKHHTVKNKSKTCHALNVIICLWCCHDWLYVFVMDSVISHHSNSMDMYNISVYAENSAK